MSANYHSFRLNILSLWRRNFWECWFFDWPLESHVNSNHKSVYKIQNIPGINYCCSSGLQKNSLLLEHFVSRNWKGLLKLGKLQIFSCISQKKRLQRQPKIRRICIRKENYSCHPVTLEWFSIQIPVNFEMLKFSLKFSFTHVRAQIACRE